QPLPDGASSRAGGVRAARRLRGAGGVRPRVHPLPARRARGAQAPLPAAGGHRPRAVRFAALIIGDEILVGKRQDKHLGFLIEALARRGLRLSSAQYLGDDEALLTAALRRSFASGDAVFS